MQRLLKRLHIKTQHSLGQYPSINHKQLNKSKKRLLCLVKSRIPSISYKMITQKKVFQLWDHLSQLYLQQSGKMWSSSLILILIYSPYTRCTLLNTQSFYRYFQKKWIWWHNFESSRNFWMILIYRRKCHLLIRMKGISKHLDLTVYICLKFWRNFTR